MDKPHITYQISRILAGYVDARSRNFCKVAWVWDAFSKCQLALESLSRIRENPDLVVSWSVGRGSWAKIPWISILDARRTGTFRSGVYCAFLFRADMSGVYLTLTQGVESTRQWHGNASRILLRERADAFCIQCSTLVAAGFTTGRIDLGVDHGLGKDYEAATIASKYYASNALPEDASLFDDVNAVLNQYEILRSDKPTIQDHFLRWGR